MNHKLKAIYNTKFPDETPSLYASSGRINLIGEHLDYNGGFVMPGSIDKCIMAAIGVNGTAHVKLYSVDMDEFAEFDLDDNNLVEQQWARYIFGVCKEFQKRGAVVKGFNAVFAGNVPLGAGLSSSAALESCFAYALNNLFNDDKIALEELAKIGQATEHNYCGVNCGIMDQFASVLGKQGKLIKLNCATLDHEYVPFAPNGYKLVLIDTKVKHQLSNSPYNQRRQSCERVAAEIGVDLLCDATRQQLEQVKGNISEEDYKRALYVISEQQRVVDACKYLNEGNYEAVGALMYETHKGLSELYEVSCDELDFLNELAKRCGVTGSRVMGGGFGGCTINLVKEELYSDFVSVATADYTAKFGHKPGVIDVSIYDGARKCE